MQSKVQSILRGSAVAVLGIVIASACAPKAQDKGAKDAGAPQSESPASGGLTTAAGATVDLVGADKVNCSGVKGEAAPKGSPVDDILGVRQGMQPGAVKAVLACHDKNFIIREDEVEYTFGEDKVPGLKMTADTGLDRVVVHFLKMGDDAAAYQLVKIGRRVEYAEGAGYEVDVLKSTLENKYGAFVDRQSYSRNTSIGALVYAADGQMLGASNTAFRSCTEGDATGVADVTVNENCAIVIGYNVVAMEGNEKRAHALTTMVAYPRLAFSGKLAALDAVKAAADARSAEVKGMAGAGKGPVL